MSNNQLAIKNLFSTDLAKEKFKELIGERSAQFITSVMQVINSNEMLKNCDEKSVYEAAIIAATLNLPINNNLGFAYIVPFRKKIKDTNEYSTVAQFQIGYKGFKQLAQRSGQFSLMHNSDVRESEITTYNRLTGQIVFDWIQDEENRKKRKVVGYVSYFKLHNGFEHTFYMPIEKIKEHAKKYSQTFKSNYGLWVDSFDEMALKTVTKLNLSKNAPLSIVMEKAMVADQAIIKDANTLDVEYVDNEKEIVDKEAIQKEMQERLDLETLK